MTPRVIFEDADIIVLEKPAGFSSETGAPAALRGLWGRPDAYVGVVHRLDTGVQGLMVCAKNQRAAAALTRQMTESQERYAALDGRAQPEGEPKSPTFIKRYRAVLSGAPDGALPAEGVLRDWLFKDSRRGKVYPVGRPRRGVKEAVLEYRIAAVADLDGPLSLAEITLHTGRTHQIRAQFAARRHPLWGDGKYGSRRKGAIALQCARLSFEHPVSGKPMEFALEAPKGEPWCYFCT